jgi:hypothetical protein
VASIKKRVANYGFQDNSNRAKRDAKTACDLGKCIMKSIFESVERIAGTSQKTARLETVTLASRSACRRNVPGCDEEGIF